MNNRLLFIMVALTMAVAASFVVFPVNGTAGDIPRISVEELNSRLGSENLIIIDSRSGSDWRGSEFKIKGAVRGKAGNEEEWSKDIPKDAEIVVYCA